MTLRKNVASQHVPFILVSATDGSLVTGATVSTEITLDGVDGTPGGSVSEIGNGRYDYAASQGDTNANCVQLLFTATGAVPVERIYYPTAANPADGVRFGLTALPNAAADAAGGLIISDAGGLDADAQRADVAAILVDTAEIGAAGAGLTNINLPNQTMDIVGNITGNLSGSVGSVTGLTPSTIADQVWEEALVDHSGTAGSTAEALAAAGSAGDPWSTALPGSYTAGQAGKIVGDNLNATVSSRSSHSAADVWAVATRTLTAFDSSFKTGYALSSAGVQAIWDALTSALTTVGSIGKLLVDNINATISSRLASASYTTPPTVGQIADQVWEEAIADHSGTVGSTAEQLAAAGAAGDPWSTALPGAYGAGTAGKIVGDNLNATVSSRATQTSVDDLPTNAELATALGTADDAVLAQVALVKAKTDLIPASPAATGDIPTAIQNADALLDRSNAIETGVTLRGATRLQLSALAGKLSGAGTGTLTFRNAVADSKDRIISVGSGGNRTTVTTDQT